MPAYTVENGGELELKARNEIYLESGFEAKAGSEFLAEIDPNLSCNSMYDGFNSHLNPAPQSLKSNGNPNQLSAKDIQDVLGTINRALARVANGTNALPYDDTTEVEEADAQYRLSSEQQNTNEVKIYPNPFSANFNLEFASVQKGGQWNIYNYQGKLIQKGIVTELKTQLELSNNADGIYFLEVLWDKGKEAHRLIKQKKLRFNP